MPEMVLPKHSPTYMFRNLSTSHSRMILFPGIGITFGDARVKQIFRCDHISILCLLRCPQQTEGIDRDILCLGCDMFLKLAL